MLIEHCSRLIFLIFIFQVKFKKNTANEETVLGGAWGHGKVLGEWRKCWGSGGGARGVYEVLGSRARVLGSGGSAGELEEVQGKWRRCLGPGKGARGVREFPGKCWGSGVGA